LTLDPGLGVASMGNGFAMLTSYTLNEEKKPEDKILFLLFEIVFGVYSFAMNVALWEVWLHIVI
jgi:hypothetical protein